MNGPQTIKRPPFLRFLSEHIRIWTDLRKSFDFLKSYQGEHRGDAHPVLVIPGFMASDQSTLRLRAFLARVGYKPYDWELGRNLGYLKYMETLATQVESLSQKHQEPVSLIGWSLGGVFARELAKENPDAVRQVITLASPFNGIQQPNNAAWLYRLIHRKTNNSKEEDAWVAKLPEPAPVPSTALYSKADGIVSWKVCRETIEDETHQNIEVHSSHLGMGFDPSVWQIIAHQLQFEKDNWTKLSAQHLERFR